MVDIRKLIEKRDNLLNEQTKNIKTHLGNVTKGVRDFLTSLDASYLPGVFQWEDISIYKDEHEEDLLMLIGIVTYEPGTDLMLDGKLVVVDEENKDYFSRVLRIGVPFSIVDQDSAEAVTTFLDKLKTAVGQDVIEDLDETTELIEQDFVKEQEAKKVPVQKANSFDFDLDELTDEQIAALRLYNLTK